MRGNSNYNKCYAPTACAECGAICQGDAKGQVRPLCGVCVSDKRKSREEKHKSAMRRFYALNEDDD